MKKHLLIGMALSIGGTAFAQSTSAPTGITPQKINPKATNLALPYLDGKGLGGPTDSFESMVEALHPKAHTKAPSHYKAMYVQDTIGTTYYQLQTNAAICNRLTKSADGTLSATWTMAQFTTWTDRGTGYNYFNGTSWGPAPGTRLENVRTGFTNIGITGSGAEFSVTHEAPTSGTGLGTHIVSRPAKGTGTWTDATIGAADTWPRLAVGGPAQNSLHIIAQTSGVTVGASFHGQDGALSYSRSNDAGVTWDKLRTVIPQIDSSQYLGFGGDSYSIDIKGSTIAIVLGGFTVDVVLIKSTDNGTTWTKTVVKQFPIPMYSAATMITDVAPTDGIADTIETNDAAVHVLLDNANNAHVWYGNMRVFCDSPGTATPDGLSYFPYTDGLMYWNETMGTAAPVMIAATQDLNGDGTLNVYTDPTGAVLGIGTFNRGLSSFPSAGIDATGKLFVTYSSVCEGINTDGYGVDFTDPASPVFNAPTSGKSYRHQYVMRSDDNGASWCTPLDITDPTVALSYEGVYGAMAKSVDGFVHVIVQQDQYPGHGVSTTTSPDIQSTTDPNAIIYYKIPVADLVCTSGIHENGAVQEMSVYPNPADNLVNLMLAVNKATKATVKIYNVVGQAITSTENNLTVGNNTLALDITNYKPGVYFVTAIIDGTNYSQKLMVK
jgi:Secretion system C-terminal sorting domain